MNKKKAFTLVELLVVIAIIAILATAGIVGYTVFTEKAKKSNAESELNQVKTLIQAEDFENPAFEIAEGEMTFTGYYCTTAVDTYAIGDWITDDAYDNIAPEKQSNFTKVTTLKQICDYSKDTELNALSGNLSYDAGKVTMISTSNSKYKAVWDLLDGAVVASKI